MDHNYTITTDHTNYPEPDDVVNAITGATGSVLLYLVTGTNDDNKQADTVMGATVAMEKGIRSLYLYLTLDEDGSRILIKHMDKYAGHLKEYMEDPSAGKEPYFMISCVPPEFGGDWFLGCGDPDAYFPIADKLGEPANRICIVYNEESVGVFESNVRGGEETAEETEETEWLMEMDLAEGQEDDGIEE